MSSVLHLGVSINLMVHYYTLPVSTVRVHGPWTRVVCTELKLASFMIHVDCILSAEGPKNAVFVHGDLDL